MKDPPEYLVVKVNHIYIRTSETLSSDELLTSVNMTETRLLIVLPVVVVMVRWGQSNDDKYCPVITRQGAIFTTVGNFKTDIFLQIQKVETKHKILDTDFKSELQIY